MSIATAVYLSLNCYLTEAKVRVNEVPVYQVERQVATSVKTIDIGSFLTQDNNTISIGLKNERGEQGVEGGAYCDVRIFSDPNVNLFAETWNAGVGPQNNKTLEFIVGSARGIQTPKQSLSLPSEALVKTQIKHLENAIKDKNIDLILHVFLRSALEKKYKLTPSSSWLPAEELFWSELLLGDVDVSSTVVSIINGGAFAHPYGKGKKPVLAITNKNKTLYIDMIFTKNNDAVVIDYIDYIYQQSWSK